MAPAPPLGEGSTLRMRTSLADYSSTPAFDEGLGAFPATAMKLAAERAFAGGTPAMCRGRPRMTTSELEINLI